MNTGVPRVTAAAILDPAGQPVSLPRPARHADIEVHMMKELKHRPPIEGTKGFMLSDGTFASRRVAWVCAKANGQLSARDAARPPQALHSHDVW